MVSASWLKKVELFEVLDEVHLDGILSHSSVRSFPEGEIIFSEGEEATRLYVLMEGAIRLSAREQDRVDFLTSQVMKEGMVFGIPSLLEPFRHNVTAKSLKHSTLLIIEADYVRSRMEEEPRMGMAIMQRLALIYFNRLNDLRKGIIHFVKAFPLKKS
jgi:CRP/FNR family transcriptional regulator, cyclic AMP receptor protein